MGSFHGAVYEALAEHQRKTPLKMPGSKDTDADELREWMAKLQDWVGLFTFHFKLEIPEISLCLDYLPRSRYGHFRQECNGFGLRGETALNLLYLKNRPYWQVLGTLLHELLHNWQQACGKPGKGNYHNRQFQQKALALGLEVDRRGHTRYLASSPFTDLLQQHGVAVKVADEAIPTHRASRAERRACGSTLKKWSCDCQNIWTGKDEIHLRCTNPGGCGKDFVKIDIG
ncbi:MAG: hypothetical protein HYX68_27295 [Planctomycetes bacterium]|nr:hypothetical protein [Planctomycetota bacterium]